MVEKINTSLLERSTVLLLLPLIFNAQTHWKDHVKFLRNRIREYKGRERDEKRSIQARG